MFQENRVVTLLNGHTGRVNVVRWIHKPDCGEQGKCDIFILDVGALISSLSAAKIVY